MDGFLEAECATDIGPRAISLVRKLCFESGFTGYSHGRCRSSCRMVSIASLDPEYPRLIHMQAPFLQSSEGFRGSSK